VIHLAGEKNFENRLKKWLESEGIYPYGYYEKRWGGGRFQKSGLPDMRITIGGIALEVELKASNGTPSDLQKHNIKQINCSGGFGFVLYPEGFEDFKSIVKGVKKCKHHIAELKPIADAHSSTKCDMLTG
jgi:hypothetical protein